MTIRVIREHGVETAEGLPHRLPEGERVLWSGKPRDRLFARDVLKTRWIAVYFGILAIWAGWAGGDGALMASLFSAGILLLIGTVAIALAEIFAWGVRKTTLYTITNKRLVMRVGVALPMNVNIPFARIVSIDMRRLPSGCGDLSITLGGDDRVSWLMLWPHIRGWKLKNPRPVLRCLGDIDTVASIMTDAIEAYGRTHAATETAGPAVETKRPAAEPVARPGLALPAREVPS